MTLASGTAALHLALLGAKIGPGDEVITPPSRGPRRRTWSSMRRHTGLRGREGGRPQHRSRARRSCDHAADEGDHPRSPGGPAGRPGRVLALGDPGDRGRDPRRRIGLPRPQDRLDRRLARRGVLAQRDEERRGAEGGILTTDDDDLAAEIHELRLMRRHAGALYDIRVAGSRRTFRTSWPRSRSSSSTRSAGTRRSGCATSPPTTPLRGAAGDHPDRPRPP